MSGLLFHNARILTMDAQRPAAEAVAVADGRIVAAGDASEAARVAGGDAERIDCGGGALLPGFIDGHCHLLAYAASLLSVDCTGARSIADIQRLVRGAAGERPAGEWIRAFGYEETALREGRHPNRHDLDAAASEHPVRLIHRSGHASVLNTRGLREAGIDIATEEPPGGHLEREPGSGEPAGLLLDMESVLEGRLPALSYEDLSQGVSLACHRMLRAGVTCLQDATHRNGCREWDLFERLMAVGALPLDVVMMESFEGMGGLPERGADGRLVRGPVKIMLHELGDELSPAEEELTRMVGEVHSAGRQVAVHAVGARAVAAAAQAIRAALRARPRADHRHRIEHCGVLPAGLAGEMAELGIVIVSQPAFVRERGDRYLKLVPPNERHALYAFRTLSAAGVALAAGSDAPVSAPAPLAGAAAAAERRTAEGHPLAPEEAVGVERALRWWTAGAAFAGFLENERGAIRPGLRADLALLARDPASCTPPELGTLPAARVWLAGQAMPPSEMERELITSRKQVR